MTTVPMAKQFALITWLLAVHAIALLAVFDTDLLYRIDRKLGTSLLTSPEITPFYEDMLGSQRQLDGSVETGSVIFLGDSITQGLNVAAVTHPAINYGIGMDTSLGLLQRISYYDALAKASRIVVAIGINDLIRTRRSNAEIIDNYRQILGRLPESVPVIIQAVFPVDERQLAAGFNQRISALNQSLQQLAQQHNAAFINLHQVMANAEGNLKTTLHTGDGVHLSVAGYRVWIDQLSSHF